MKTLRFREAHSARTVKLFALRDFASLIGRTHLRCVGFMNSRATESPFEEWTSCERNRALNVVLLQGRCAVLLRRAGAPTPARGGGAD